MSFWGPLNLPDGADLAGGTSAEDAGHPSGLALGSCARPPMLVAVAAMGAAGFLGGWWGPLLPGPVWMLAQDALPARRAGGDAGTSWRAYRIEPFVIACWIVLIPLALLNIFVSRSTPAVIPSPLVDALFWCFASCERRHGIPRVPDRLHGAGGLLVCSPRSPRVGAILVLLGAEFLGIVLILMMAGEMLIMAIVMVMYMMNPAGLNPMWMVHQHRVAVVAGVVSFVGLVVGHPRSPTFPSHPVDRCAPRPSSWASSCSATPCWCSRRPASRCSRR